MMGIEWSRSMLEYIDIASNVTNSVLGRSSRLEIFSLSGILSLTH